MGPTIMENRRAILQKSKLSIPLLGLYPKEMKSASQRDSHTPIFCSSFSTARIWKAEPECPSTGE